MKILPLVIAFVMISQTSTAQSCCATKSATASFASLTALSEFRSAHAEPLPFRLTDARGTTISFMCSDATEGRGYMVQSASSSNKYVFMIHEWWGLNDYIRREAEALQAELGDVNVFALDLYDGNVATTREAASKLMSEVNEHRVRSIIDGAISYVGDDARVCTIGWCFGGGWSLQTSLMLGPQAVGCVMYYGMPESDERKLASLKAPVLFIHATKDGWITTDIVQAFSQRMKRLSKNITIKEYSADHAFANPSNPIYNKSAAEDAHKHVLAFLKEHLMKP